MRRPNLDAARVWDLVLSSGGVRGSGVMRRGGQTLCVVFLLSVMLQPAAKKPCSPDIVINVKTLIKNASQQMDLDTRLYTPNLTDYRKCPKSTMTCFAKEAKVLVNEWEKIPIRLNKRLEAIAQMLKQSRLDCPVCEVYMENATVEFLEDLLQVLQAMNADNCQPNSPAGG